MAFAFSKILSHLLAPSNLLVLLALSGLTMQAFGRYEWQQRGRILIAVVVGLMATLMLLPVGMWLLLPLEARFPAPVLPEKADGVIVLGRAVDPSASAVWGRPTLNGGADCITEFTALARRYPTAKLIFTGGLVSLTNPELSEAPMARQVMERIGAPVYRVTFEAEARNTYENALFAQKLAKPAPGETWILISSAMHMPRAVGVFRKIGWKVVPYPVAYRSGKDAGTRLFPGLSSTLSLLDDVSHEWLGLVAYWLLNRTSAVVPGPQ